MAEYKKTDKIKGDYVQFECGHIRYKKNNGKTKIGDLLFCMQCEVRKKVVANGLRWVS